MVNVFKIFRFLTAIAPEIAEKTVGIFQLLRKLVITVIEAK